MNRFFRSILYSVTVLAFILLQGIDAARALNLTALPPPGLVGWYRAEGNPNDIAGGNNGTLQGNTNYTTGTVGRAFMFDGLGDGVLLGNPAKLQLQSFTIEGWIKRADPVHSSQDAADSGVLFAYGQNGYGFAIAGANFPFGRASGELFLTKVGADNIGSGFTITDTQFHHVALTKSSNKVVFYLDGAASAPITYNSVFSFGTNVAIGIRGDLVDSSFIGSVDELSIYNRALTAVEIRSIFDAGSTGKATNVVNTSADSVDATTTITSLREAITQANASIGDRRVIGFNIPTPPLGAVSRYPAESAANDTVGSNHGVLQNGTTFTQGLIGRAFRLDGVNDFVNVPNSSSLNFGTSDFSISVWVDFNNLSGEQVILEKYVQANLSPAVVSGWSLTKLSSNALSFVLGAPPDTIDTGVLSLATGVWNHIAVTRAGNTFTIFMNGIAIASRTSSKNVDSISSLKFGHRGSPSDTPGSVDTRGFYLNGSIDEAEIYKRALSASEVRSLFLLGSAFATLPVPGLVSEFRAEDNANDSADSNSGTLQGGTTFVEGRVGKAFIFDGVDDYVAIPHNPNLNPAGSFSVELWVKADQDQFSPDGQYLIVDKSHGFSDGTGWALQGDPDGTVDFFFGKGGATGDPSNFVGVSTHESILDGQWHHLAGTFDGAQITIWLDGVLDNTQPFSGSPVGNSREVEIGRAWGGGAPRRFFHGLIDELRIYNRALTPAEIEAAFDAGNSTVDMIQTISPSLALPAITYPVTIDGYSQPGSKPNLQPAGHFVNPTLKIEVEGSKADSPSIPPGVVQDGLRINAGGTSSTIRGLTINRFSGSGIQVTGAGGNTIEGNFIGSDPSGASSLGNALHGVRLLNSAGNTIGGTSRDSANRISDNGQNGIAIEGDSSTANAILGNSIFNNTGFGIDLANNGLTPNDATDSDSGPNRLQNFPALDDAITTMPGGKLKIQGTLDSTSNTVFRIEFFSSDTPDPSGFGEGRTFLGATQVTTNPAGHASFSVALSGDFTATNYLTATATDQAGNTSEFSRSLVRHNALRQKWYLYN